MAIRDEIPNKTPAQLKRFWLETAAILTVIAALGFLIPYFRTHEVRTWPGYLVGAAAGVTLCATLFPAGVLDRMYRTYMVPFVLIGLVMSRVVLGILFFGVVLPVGILMRAFGKDPMRRTLDKSATTYRNPSQNPSRESVEAPF